MTAATTPVGRSHLLLAAGRLHALALGGAIGFVMAFVAFKPRFLLGTAARWTHPANDYIAYLVSWRYFVQDAWRLPLLDVPAMGYPEGGSVLFNDGLPLAVIPAKLLATLGGPIVNPFGIWMLATYVLQGAMAARFVRAHGVRDWWAIAAGAVFAVTVTGFTNRFEHVAVSSHFLLLWALALYVESRRAAHVAYTEQVALSLTALLVNPYLFLMVSAIQLVTLASVLARARPTAAAWRAAVRPLAVWAVLLAGSMAALGYGAFLDGTIESWANGFGEFSWNLPTLIVPPTFFGQPLPLVRDATGGQYEGESYIGLGAVVVLVTAIATRPRVVLDQARRNVLLLVLLVFLGALAASHHVFVGSYQLLSVPLPASVERALGSFRASGRFVWPLAYVLALVPLTVVVTHWRKRAAMAIVMLAVLLQVHEWRPAAAKTRQWSGGMYVPEIQEDLLRRWFAHHHRVFQFPSYWCGGVNGPPQWGGPSANRELQIQWLAAQVGTPINSVYTSRRVKRCETEAAWARAPVIEPGVLYLVSPERSRRSAPLRRALAQVQCRHLEWALACSRELPQEVPSEHEVQPY